MTVVRYLKVASVVIGLSVGSFLLAPRAQASDGVNAPEISTRGEAKRTVIRHRVEVLELRGERRNPNFLEQSFHAAEVQDVERWNHQHDHIAAVKGLKRHGSRMPAGEIVKTSTKPAKLKARSVALQK